MKWRWGGSGYGKCKGCFAASHVACSSQCLTYPWHALLSLPADARACCCHWPESGHIWPSNACRSTSTTNESSPRQGQQSSHQGGSSATATFAQSQGPYSRCAHLGARRVLMSIL